jgi:hypothetical protein
MPSYSLNNFTAPDAYLAPGATGTNSRAQTTGPATLQMLPLLDHVNIDVANGGIYFSLLLANSLDANASGGSWQPETFMLPGSKSLTRSGLVGIRVRAAVTGANLAAAATQAQVTVEAIDQT